MDVKAWQEYVSIPTYKTGDPDKNPMFLENRVYQGSSGVVYPHAVIDKVYDEKENKAWNALYLENDFIRIMVLPELGGRIQMAYDKTNDYHFIYHNEVIKPALVGLAGPWISGGIEFNWPQHHRPSTFDPVDYSIEENADGSKTIWVNEYEKMFRTKCALGFTLYPDKAFIELKAKIYNRTPFPQSFLWWANPAVAVDEHYQSVFPPDVNAVFDHGKRDVSSFPIAKGTYYKVDYSPGTDISVYTNIPVPTSYMAVDSEFNFVGGYHHKKKAGMLHVANHYVSPGKKQWTWGCGEFGKAWDRQLTDKDGPYFELMCGVFTDNQPDFSWIMPNEVREFTQYFMPYKEIGYVKNASASAMVNLELLEKQLYAGVYVTEQRNVNIRILKGSTLVYTTSCELSPLRPFSEYLPVENKTGESDQYSIEVIDPKEGLLISYTPVERKTEAIPDPASPIPEPALVESAEALYLAGLHLEQYRHATYAPEDYYLEALRRDATDSRSNHALGLLYLRSGLYKKAEKYLHVAVDKIMRHNPNPADGEPVYNLGLCLRLSGQYKEAYKYFYKSAWNAAHQDNAYYQLACLDAINTNWTDALHHINKSLQRNIVSSKARHLKAIVLRMMKQYESAISFGRVSVEYDRFDYASRFELYRSLQEAGQVDEAMREKELIRTMMRDDSHTCIEIALDYAYAGQYEIAQQFLSLPANHNGDPLLFYYKGYFLEQLGNREEALLAYQAGASCGPDRVFPNRLEDIDLLLHVIAVNPSDYKACYYIGNFCYAKKRYDDARDYWEKSVALNPSFATAHRNLGIAYYNKFDRKEEALIAFEQSFTCDSSDSRVLFELDQLRKRVGQLPETRLGFLSTYPALVCERDDLYAEYILLLLLTGREQEALQWLNDRNFHPWEGGEGKVSGLYVHLHIEIAKQLSEQHQYEESLTLLKRAQVYPDNLGEGKLYGAQENDIFFWMGCVFEKTGNRDAATTYWKKAAIGISEPAPAIFYNDQQPDKIFYQAEALKKLGARDEAGTRCRKLIEYGEQHLDKPVKTDFFAVSLPDLMIFTDDLSKRNTIHCYYLMGLGHLGLGEYEIAMNCFDKILVAEPAHTGVYIHLKLLKSRRATLE